MSEVSKIFDFACANPDYWTLMREAGEPPEVAELEDRRRQAFNAAREEVQRLSGELLDELHAKMKAKAKGTPMEGVLSKSVKRQSYEKALFHFEVFSGKGKLTWLRISIEPGSDSRIGAYCRLGTPANRQEDMFDSFRTTVGEARMQISGNEVYVEEPIALGAALSDIASRLVDVFWPGVLAYSAKLLAAAKPADADEDAEAE